MKNKQYLTMMLFMMFSIYHSQSQTPKKYAILITGCKPSVGISDNPNPNIIGSDFSNHPFDEFWNDTYLMWELLTQQYEFSNENVKVLYYAGNDWQNIGSGSTNDRYKASKYFLEKITDYPADTNTITQVFTDLKNVMTDEDFLFVWTFGHGNKNTLSNQGLLRAYDPIYQSDTVYMQDNRFGQLVKGISAAKKVVWMQQCFGGDFYDNITSLNTYFLSAGLPGEITHWAEDICPANYKNERYYIGSTLVDTCYHGEFNFHMYSSQNGFSPSGSPHHGDSTDCQNIFTPYANIDANADGFIDHGESFMWLDTAEYSQETPMLKDTSNLIAYTSFQFPTLLHDELTQSMTCRGLIGISNATLVREGTTLKFMANSKVHMLNGGQLIVEPNATLVIENGVEFIKDFAGPARIEVRGAMSTCSYVTFNGKNFTLPLEIITNNVNNSFMINNCIFINCVYRGMRGLVALDKNAFSKSYCSIGSTMPQQNLVYIRENNFQGNHIPHPAIEINGMKKYVVIGNAIDQFQFGAVIWNSGKSSSPYFLSNNIITSCDSSGVRFYNSRATVSYNTITGNYKGIESKNNSTLYMYGLCNANSVSQTQQVSFNTNIQIESTSNFPITFKHNSIESINGDTAVRCRDCMPNTICNIEKNYWGTNITTAKMQKLLSITPSTSSFDWDPVWYLSDDCNSGGGIPDPQRRAADSTYQVGIQYNDFGDYAMAKSVFTSIIYQYPTTEFAQSALYELFFLESMLGEKYNDLKDLYESDPVIVNNPGLAKVASFMANQCNVELKNYSDAIAWYESVIDNPATFNDSIFAIIDLGYTYLLAEADTVKSCPRGRYEEYKPESQPEFVDYRDYLLSLVNRGKSAIPATDSELHPVVIKSVNPNPASESINIQFDILAEGDISFNVRNTLGQSVLAIPEEHLNKGTHFKYINISSIAPGTYVLTISIYGQLSDSHKLIKYSGYELMNPVRKLV